MKSIQKDFEKIHVFWGGVEGRGWRVGGIVCRSQYKSESAPTKTVNIVITFMKTGAGYVLPLMQKID